MKLPTIPNVYVLAILAVGLVLAVWLAVWFLGAPQRAAQAGQDATVAQQQGKGASDNAKAAIDVIGKNAAGAEAIDQTTGDNDARIKRADGAGAQVGGGVDLAGRCAVCLRNSAKGSPSCQRLLKSGSCGMAPGR